MATDKSEIRTAVLGILAVGLLLSPLSLASLTSQRSGIAHAGSVQITFEPSIVPLELEVGEAPAGFEPTQSLSITISGNTFIIGTMSYPIGDVFPNADGIPLASVEQSLLGDFGYATILAQGAEGYRLVWVTDRTGERKYIIVPEENVLFSGPDGFKKQLEDLETHETHLRNSVGALIAATGTVVAIDLGLCPVTLGAGCAKAAFTALLGGIGAAGASIWFLFHDVVPAQTDVVNEFTNLDINLP